MDRDDLPPVYDQAPCGLVTIETNGMIRRTNETFCRWLGYSNEELTGSKKLQDLFTVGSRVFHYTHWAPLMQMQGSVTEVQLDLNSRNDGKIPMLVNASTVEHGGCVFYEVALFMATDRKQYERELLSARRSLEDALIAQQNTQKELETNRRFLSIAIRSARMGVWSQDLTTKAVTFSDELLQLLGLESKNEYHESPDFFFDLVHPDDVQGFKQAISSAIQSATEFEVQFRLKHATGNWLAMEGRGHGTHNVQGQAINIVGVFIDISERKAAEQKLHEVYQKLRIADRRKDEFLATLGHELRNPLAPIKNVLEIMHSKEASDPFVIWAREVMERHVSQLTHLVDDLLEASRISHDRLILRREPVDVAELVKSAIDSVQILINDKRHDLSVTLPSKPVIIDADATRVIQIITNLLNNAAKYTPEQGEIDIAVSTTETFARVMVRDSGIGLPEENLHTIFDMFSQIPDPGNRMREGLGIGLALVAKLVEMHGGTVEAFSQGRGQGSEFTVRLPLGKEPIRTDGSKKIPSMSKAAAENVPRRILIIDDNTDSATTLALLIEALGHTTKVAHDGGSGLAIATEFNPQVTLLDIGLPDMNGYEVARKIRSHDWGKNMVLIATTGWGQEEDKQRAKLAGFDEHITKPLDINFLREYLSKLPAGEETRTD